MMPKALTKASVVSSTDSAVVVENRAMEMTASGMETMRVVRTRPHPSLSCRAATITSRIEMREVTPAKTRAPKNSTPMIDPPVACDTIVGKATNARPMPEVATPETSVPCAWAMNPSAANTPMPARISKPELANATTRPEPVRSVLRLR